MLVYPCLAWPVSPSLAPLNAYICRACLAPVREDPAQKSLLDISAPLSYRWSGATLTSRCMNLWVFSLQIILFLYQLNLWVVYWLYPSNLVCFISKYLKSLNVYQSWSHVAAHKIKSHVTLLSGNLLGKDQACVELKQESHAQLSMLVNLCFSCAMPLPWTTLVDSKPCGYPCLLSLLCIVLVLTTQSMPLEISHWVYVW